MIQVTLPQLSLSMEEGKVARWLVAEGTLVAAGQAIVEIETDKAITEVEAPAAGTIHRLAQEGTMVAVEAALAEITDGASSASPEVATNVAAVPTETNAIAVSGAGELAPTPRSIEPSYENKHRASPAARRLAKERGIDLPTARGSGPDGRIIARDLEERASFVKPTLRESVVAQLVASWREIPHIHIGGELDGSGLAAAKRTAAAGITVTDLMILAIVRALRAVPELNGVLGKPSHRVHLALAVATPGGVISPVIRNAHELSLAEIARERARLVAAARTNASDRRDLAGARLP